MTLIIVVVTSLAPCLFVCSCALNWNVNDVKMTLKPHRSWCLRRSFVLARVQSVTGCGLSWLETYLPLGSVSRCFPRLLHGEHYTGRHQWYQGGVVSCAATLGAAAPGSSRWWWRGVSCRSFFPLSIQVCMCEWGCDGSINRNFCVDFCLTGANLFYEWEPLTTPLLILSLCSCLRFHFVLFT